MQRRQDGEVSRLDEISDAIIGLEGYGRLFGA
jgi:hypothetical protein